MNKQLFLKTLCISILAVLVAVAGVVFVFDPFYHYHKPWFGMKAVLSDKEYQCVGTLRHFDYDALIVGSSVVENNDNAWYDADFGVKSIKAVRSYGMTADLCYLLDEAFAARDVKQVFYNIDPAALVAEPVTTYESTGAPMYLYDHNPFNDVKYLFNKDVLFEKIPYEVVQSLSGDYNEGLSYNWAKWKTFHHESALGLYFRPLEVREMLPEDSYEEHMRGNIALLTAQVEKNPQTQFRFFFPAYSMLWWDGIVRSGERDAYLYAEKETIRTLLQYDNVEVYCFQTEEDITTNLDLYLDSIHFSPEINHEMEQQMLRGENRLTTENYEETIENLRDFTDRVVNELIVPYEEQDLLTYEIPGVQN